jgi:HEPN domain-containing protein
LASGRLFLYPICFHAQQAAEKYLKAYLTWRQIEFPKTHAIEKLIELIQGVDVDLAAWLLDSAALTPYGVELRYPGNIPDVTEQDAEEAVRLGEKVREAVTKRLTGTLP